MCSFFQAWGGGLPPTGTATNNETFACEMNTRKKAPQSVRSMCPSAHPFKLSVGSGSAASDGPTVAGRHSGSGQIPRVKLPSYQSALLRMPPSHRPQSSDQGSKLALELSTTPFLFLPWLFAPSEGHSKHVHSGSWATAYKGTFDTAASPCLSFTRSGGQARRPAFTTHKAGRDA